MAGQTKRKSPIETARDAVLEQRGKLLEWETTLESARGELARLEGSAGELALDDPAAALALPRQMQELRDRVMTAERALEAQALRVRAAESAYLLAHAEALDGPVQAAKAALATHEARTAELLALLEEHEGRFVPEPLLVMATHQAGEPMSIDLHRSETLRDQVAAAERPVQVLRDLAAGREPVVDSVEDYPACVWGPEALVPAPAYLRTLAREEQAELTARNSLRVVEQQVADLEAKLASGDTGPGGVQDWTMAPRPDHATQLVAARAHLDRLRERLAPAADSDRVSATTP